MSRRPGHHARRRVHRELAAAQIDLEDLRADLSRLAVLMQARGRPHPSRRDTGRVVGALSDELLAIACRIEAALDELAPPRP